MGEAGYWKGDIPFGYIRVDHRILGLNSSEAERVRLAFQMGTTGEATVGQVARLLNNSGFSTR